MSTASYDTMTPESDETSLSMTEVLSMVKFGANKIFKKENSQITDEDIDTIISRSKKR